tara:strand:+ start:1468 stop:1920 length:453 start_codon:yes stop_codon:yes gene_type:complete
MINIDTKRHLAKTISWRVIGTIDTIILSWIISGDPLIGLSIGAAEVITKMTLYFLHERIWFKIPWGIQRPRKVYSEIQWDTNEEDFEQVEFLEYENEEIRKRVKVARSLKSPDDYCAILSTYDKQTKRRMSSIFSGNKNEIEDKLNIKIS